MAINDVRFKGSYKEYKRIGDNTYEFILYVKRKSETYDAIPCKMQSDNESMEYFKFMQIEITGKICSTSKFVKNRNRLEVFIKVQKIEFYNGKEFYKKNNIVTIEGIICKDIIFRKSKKGTRISDFLLEINISEGMIYHIPCIAWEKDAKDIFNNFSINDYIKIKGRLQSREYPKRYADGTVEIRTVNEVSIVEFQ